MSRTARSSVARQRLAQRWRKADFPQRRQMILRIALRLLHRHGLQALTMRRVATELGLGAMTLYTYFPSQHELHREMVRWGFQELQNKCRQNTTLGTPNGWRGGARAYIQFALEHPNLYQLMFSTPMRCDDHDLLHGGFQTLLDKVSQQLAQHGLQEPQLQRQARTAAGRFWIALHGLATLAIAGRLVVLEGDLDQILDDLLQHVAPT